MENNKERNYKFFGKNSNPRLCFWIGILLGSLIMSLAATAYIGYLFMGGKFLLQPEETDFNLKSEEIVLVEQAVEKLDNNSQDVEIGEYDYIYGQEESEITLVVYTDYECQLCKIYRRNLLKFVDNNPGKVKLVVKNFVLSQKHPEALNAAIAGICAGEQGKYYEFTNGLYNNQNLICGDYYEQLAKEVELDIDEFKTCQENENIKNKIETDYQQGLELGVNGIPNTVVMYPDNSLKLIDGDVSVEFLQSLLKEYL